MAGPGDSSLIAIYVRRYIGERMIRTSNDINMSRNLFMYLLYNGFFSLPPADTGDGSSVRSQI